MPKENYAGYKWTRSDREREKQKSSGPYWDEFVEARANSENRELDRRNKLTRDENKYEENTPKRTVSYNDPGYAREEQQFNRHQQQEAQNRSNARRNSKYSRDEQGFNRQNQTSNKVSNSRRNAAYSREEDAFNRGRDQDRDRRDNARRRTERTLHDLERKATNLVKPSTNPVPSQNPTAAGGREWKNHKYIAKVQTKNGKIRYIYDVNTSTGDHSRTNKMTKEGQSRYNLKKTQEKSNSRNTGGGSKVHNPISDAQRTISRASRNAKIGLDKAINNVTNSDVYKNTANAIADTVNNASKAVSDGTDFVKNKLNDLGNMKFW